MATTYFNVTIHRLISDHVALPSDEARGNKRERKVPFGRTKIQLRPDPAIDLTLDVLYRITFITIEYNNVLLYNKTI